VVAWAQLQVLQPVQAQMVRTRPVKVLLVLARMMMTRLVEVQPVRTRPVKTQQELL
jgi:hypothetical protein